MRHSFTFPDENFGQRHPLGLVWDAIFDIFLSPKILACAWFQERCGATSGSDTRTFSSGVPPAVSWVAELAADLLSRQRSRKGRTQSRLPPVIMVLGSLHLRHLPAFHRDDVLSTETVSRSSATLCPSRRRRQQAVYQRQLSTRDRRF